jgi:NAD(P)-dependent dehydrogenase (short-subunit alcohol dehydrogenase family)
MLSGLRAAACATTGQPAELAPSYVFFASQESSYITADVMAVTGGRSVV